MDEITLEQCPEDMQEEIQMFLREKCELCDKYGVNTRTAYQTVEKYIKKTPCPKTQRQEKTNN